MRRLTLMAALAAATTLAGCTLKTPEGAACDRIGDVDQCPEGQRCGADGKCSVAATECGPSICTASSCSGPAGDETLSRCDQSGVCASLTTVPCSDHQDCSAEDGACVCAASACDGIRASLCNAGGELVGCNVEGATNCPYEDPPVGCGALKECKDKDAASSECRCKVVPECPEVGTFCIENGTRLVTCGEDETCVHARADVRCALGQNCDTGACACPRTDLEPVLGGGCATVNDLACGGTTLLKCLPVAVSSPCNAWQVEQPCGDDFLTCAESAPGAAACVCPPFVGSPRTLLADAGAPTVVGLFPNGNGAQAPLCRFKTLGAAAAEAALLGGTVKAVGSGSQLTFLEPGFTLQPGVNLVGDESDPVEPTRVVLELDGPDGLKVAAGATLRGVTIRKRAGSTVTVAVEVLGGSASLVPSISDVRVDTVAPSEPFTTGVAVGGSGAVAIQRLSVADALGAGFEVSRTSVADTVTVTELFAKGNAPGVLVTRGDLALDASVVRESVGDGVIVNGGAAGTTKLTLTNSGVVRNGGTGVAVSFIDGFVLKGSRICANTGTIRSFSTGPRRAGGLFAFGSAPANATFNGNLVHHNAGDQVLVGGSATSTWGLASPGCEPGQLNVFAAYATGVGVAVVNGGVDAFWNAWDTDFPPMASTDYVALGQRTAGTPSVVNALGTGTQYCTRVLVAEADCPP